MKFNCENCGTRYTLSDEKVKNRILKIRCKVCEEVIIVRDPSRAASRPPSLAPEPMPEVEWYVSRAGGAAQGPMPIERLEDQIRSGDLDPADMVWNQDMPEWASAEMILEAQFKAARATVPRPPLPTPSLPHSPGAPGKGPTPFLPRPRSAIKTPAPLAAPKPPAPSLPPAAPMPPAASKPPAPSLPPGDAADGDTVALPASGGQIDTLFAPAATASAAAAMQADDTTLLPTLDASADAPLTDWESLGAPPDGPEDADLDALRLSVAGPALPSSEPPAVAPAPDEDDDGAVPMAPVAVVAPPAAITMTGEQVAFAEGAFFGTGERPATGPAPSGSVAAISDPDVEERSKLPLFIVLGVLLLGGGIALGVMFTSDSGGVAPVTTGSTASATPETEAPASLAAATDAPASEAPASAVSDAPASTDTDAPASEAPASVASAAPVSKAPPKRPTSAAARVKPKTVDTAAPASAAPATRASRFASLNGKKPKDVPVAALQTDASIELPETLSPSKISSIIRRYKKGLHGCYQRQLKRDASMRKANLKLAFSIERSGHTSNIKIDRKYDGTELKTCLNRLVRRWRFPQFTGESIPVEYPLFFQASL